MVPTDGAGTSGPAPDGLSGCLVARYNFWVLVAGGGGVGSAVAGDVTARISDTQEGAQTPSKHRPRCACSDLPQAHRMRTMTRRNRTSTVGGCLGLGAGHCPTQSGHPAVFYGAGCPDNITRKVSHLPQAIFMLTVCQVLRLSTPGRGQASAQKMGLMGVAGSQQPVYCCVRSTGTHHGCHDWYRPAGVIVVTVVIAVECELGV
jgi:hypothetical protein